MSFLRPSNDLFLFVGAALILLLMPGPAGLAQPHRRLGGVFLGLSCDPPALEVSIPRLVAVTDVLAIFSLRRSCGRPTAFRVQQRAKDKSILRS
jgi:hypothetical protein